MSESAKSLEAFTNIFQNILILLPHREAVMYHVIAAYQLGKDGNPPVYAEIIADELVKFVNA